MLLLGKILRPHGLEGVVRVWSYARSGASFLEAGEILLRPVLGRPRSYKVLSAKPHKNILLMQLEGVDSLEQAEELRQAEILVRAEAVTREEGEYFWQELIGLKVFLDTGEYVGDVSRIISAGGNEIYAVGHGIKEIFFPATHDVVKEINLEQGKMIVSAMEGLLELNES
jgi:16S rRNA processing protein RimM